MDASGDAAPGGRALASSLARLADLAQLQLAAARARQLDGHPLADASAEQGLADRRESRDRPTRQNAMRTPDHIIESFSRVYIHHGDGRADLVRVFFSVMLSFSRTRENVLYMCIPLSTTHLII